MASGNKFLISTCLMFVVIWVFDVSITADEKIKIGV